MTNITKNIKKLRKEAGYTQESFAKKLGVKRSLIGSYEEGRAEPRLQTVNKIASLLNVSTDVLINADLTTGQVKNRQIPMKVLSITVDDNDREYIDLVPQKASAGYLNGYGDPEYVADLPKFRLPFLPTNATYRAFEIKGDSMLPLCSGTIVIGKYLESVSDIDNGKTYVLLTTQEGIVYKRVFNYVHERGKLYLVSDNKSYSAYEVEANEVEEIWEAKAYISVQFPDATSAQELNFEKITGLVKEIHGDVKHLRKNLCKK